MPGAAVSPGEEPSSKRAMRARAVSSPVLPRLSIIRQPPPGGLSAPFSVSNDSRSPSATPAHPFSDDESQDSQEGSSWSQLDAPRAAHPAPIRSAAAAAHTAVDVDTSPTDAAPPRHGGRTRRQQALELSSTPEDPDQALPEEGLVNVPPHLKRLLNGAGRIQRRSRRKVEVETTDKYGRPLSPSDIRRMKRRITNRDSARRMRLLRQAELEKVRDEVQQLVENNVRLAARLRAAESAGAEGQQESASWQQLWHAAMAANLRLSDRLAGYENAAKEGPGMQHPLPPQMPAAADVDLSSLPSSMDFSLQLPSASTAAWGPKPSPLFAAHPGMLPGAPSQPSMPSMPSMKPTHSAAPSLPFGQGPFKPMPSLPAFSASLPASASPAPDLGPFGMSEAHGMGPDEMLLEKMSSGNACLAGFPGAGFSYGHSHM